MAKKTAKKTKKQKPSTMDLAWAEILGVLADMPDCPALDGYTHDSTKGDR